MPTRLGESATTVRFLKFDISLLMNINDLLSLVIDRNASDLHLMVGTMPTIRINGDLSPVKETSVLTAPVVEEWVYSTVTPNQKELLLTNKEVDYSFELKGKARFRVNAFFQRGTLAAAFRHIPNVIKSVEQLNLPTVLDNFARLPQGFILVTGPTGHGKSSTLAAMIDRVNHDRSVHIVTVEDPIEYIFTPDKALIAQREMHNDTHSFQIALRSALREDIDVVLIGEMRDQDTISAALTIAETGHLVFATLHTNSAAQSVDRIIDVFPENQQNQVRQQLANVVQGVVSQRLVKGIEGGRFPATEVLIANSAVRNLIREQKTHMIDNVIATSTDLGMMTLETSLGSLVTAGKVSLNEAMSHSLRPNELMRLVKNTKDG